jgi:nitrogen PTS system EIIA component
MNIDSLISLSAVIAQLHARDKKQALKLLSAHAAPLTGLTEREIFSVLMERELISCTAMGNGVCIPHGRFANVASPYALFASLEKPIDFGAADGRPVDLIFLLLSPSNTNTEHLKALAIISRILRNKSLCETLRKTKDVVAIHTLLTTERGEE